MIIGLSLLVILPRWQIIVISLVLVSVAFIPTTIHIQTNQAQITVLDVGQGLSVLISTKNHRLLYDTGLKFYGGGGDIGESVVVPYFRYFAIHSLDVIVVSHTDLDHRGGLDTISRAYPNAQLLTDSPHFYHRGENCHTYPAWTWDGIEFEFLSLQPFF